MKHPLESLMTAAGILLMALLSACCCPPLRSALRWRKTGRIFHLMDLNQLYTLLFCLWFLLLGALEYYVIRFIWRRWFSLAD
ncbi:DUF1158 family protein [Salmonella enterica subsp. enterica serovar Worthington]|nr:DUF1158 family protein [Salmonella enterica subsp. enterica serovar Worthington]